MDLFCSTINSPIGVISIFANANAVNEITFSPKEALGLKSNDWSELAAKELQQYFDGELLSFSFPMAHMAQLFSKRFGVNY